MKKIIKPKVFISYSWSTPNHEKFVIEICERLMSNGIDVILDKWNLKEGQDKNEFMEKMVNDPSVEKVLILSDKIYTEKANKRKGGVGTESQIISSEVYSKLDQEKFIPIITEVDGDGNPYLPTFLKSRVYVDLRDNESFYGEFEKLVRNIFNKPLIKKPELGLPPKFVTDDEPIIVKSKFQFDTFKDAFLNNKVNTKILSKDFLNSIIENLEDFRVSSNADLDEKIFNSIEMFKPYRDLLLKYFELTAQSDNYQEYYDQIFNFIEEFLPYYYPPDSMDSYHDEWFDNYKFMLREIFVYLNAILLKNGKIEELNQFTRDNYYYKTKFDTINYNYTQIDGKLRSLDDIRNSRLKLNKISLSANMLRDRADSKVISFDKFVEMDFILTLKSLLGSEDDFIRWFPRSIVFHVGWRVGSFELFKRAESERYFKIVGKLFGVKNKSELSTKFDNIFKSMESQPWRYGHNFIDFKILMNYEKLYDS